MTTQTEFGLRDYLAEEGRLLITSPSFDFDSYEVLGDKLVSLLSASVVEKQWDADMHSWLIDFEGCRMFLKSEHYSESIWFESLNVDESKEEFDYLAQLFRSGF